MWGWLGDWTSQDYIVLEEIARMKLHQKVAAVLVSSLGLVSWGCSGDDVESGVNKVGDGVQSTGKKIESAGEASTTRRKASARLSARPKRLSPMVHTRPSKA